jgi:glycerol-3-phosphate dehydrogenase
MMPWKGRTLVGTTETSYRGDPRAAEPLRAEVDYLLETFVRYFPDASTRVVDAWAGLRVLPARGGSAFGRPRDVRLVADDRSHPRVISIYGGKLTGYRATAERVVRMLRRSLPPREARADTRRLILRA